MSKNILTREQVIARIMLLLSAQSLRSLAREWSVSHSYLQMVINGKTLPGPKILDRLGLRRIILYEKETETKRNRNKNLEIMGLKKKVAYTKIK
jgi:hypothetical protein